jgi:hypothetical protein
MSDTEFDLLDELYFVKSFSDLQHSLGWHEEKLKAALQALHAKAWLEYYASVSKEPLTEITDFNTAYQKYYYLATKAGLLAHNSK